MGYRSCLSSLSYRTSNILFTIGDKMIYMVMFGSFITMMVSSFLWVYLGLMERERDAMICEPCGSTVYFAEDLSKCRIDSSCSAPMGEWDESFVDGLSE